MPAICRLEDYSTGHGCFSPTQMITTPISKTYFNGKYPGVKHDSCRFQSHTCGLITHSSSERYPIEGALKTYIEGYLVARIGDAINCGDVIGQGSYNSFVE